MNLYKPTKLNSRGFSHHIVLPAIVIVLIALAGVRVMNASHAATLQSVNSAAIVNATKTVKPLSIHVKGNKLKNGSNKTIRLLGVDASGTEDACIQNNNLSWGFANTVAEDEASAVAMVAWHINAVRVPLNEDCWLNINDKAINPAYVGVNYQTAIENWVSALNNAGIYTILDLHWAAPGTYSAAQQWPMADEDHAPAFWNSVASTFKSNPAVIFDPFNEPFIGSTAPTAANWSCWLRGCSTTYTDTINGVANSSVTYTTAGMQQLVNTIRATGSTQPIILGGLNWSGDPCGTKNGDGNGGKCSEITYLPTDPQKQLAISFHTYNWTACTAINCWDSMAKAAIAAKVPIITGELGERDCTAQYINNYMSWADANKLSYLFWSWEVNYQTSCVPWTGPTTPGGGSLQLLSNYDGTPSSIAPEATDIRSHLIQENP